MRPFKKVLPLKMIPVKTNAGIFLLEFSPIGLCSVRFPTASDRRTPTRCDIGHLVGVKWFRERVPLDLSDCTLFERRVYLALRKIPAGKTETYGELARRAGYPGSARAVGNAMKKNRLPLVIPCHRVIPAAGGIGGYSAGKAWKRFLLDRELRAARNANSRN